MVDVSELNKSGKKIEIRMSSIVDGSVGSLMALVRLHKSPGQSFIITSNPQTVMWLTCAYLEAKSHRESSCQ